MKKATGKFLVVLVAALSVCLMLVNAYAKEPYKIGALFAVTGAASFLGEPEKNTALMLQEQINKTGGINGHPLEIIIEDTKSDETQAVLSAKKLLENDKVLAIVGPSTTGESMALVPILNTANTPLLSCAAGAPIPAGQSRPWILNSNMTLVQ
jgi:branched-chain amino acid transport system substrate-binding protein